VMLATSPLCYDDHHSYTYYRSCGPVLRVVQDPPPPPPAPK